MTFCCYKRKKIPDLMRGIGQEKGLWLRGSKVHDTSKNVMWIPKEVCDLEPRLKGVFCEWPLLSEDQLSKFRIDLHFKTLCELK